MIEDNEERQEALNDLEMSRLGRNIAAIEAERRYNANEGLKKFHEQLLQTARILCYTYLGLAVLSLFLFSFFRWVVDEGECWAKTDWTSKTLYQASEIRNKKQDISI